MEPAVTGVELDPARAELEPAIELAGLELGRLDGHEGQQPIAVGRGRGQQPIVGCPPGREAIVARRRMIESCSV